MLWLLDGLSLCHSLPSLDLNTSSYCLFPALESEFLVPDDASSHKPATIQPLENILANLKSSSTFKPTNQKEDLGQEASRIIQSLPNLSFMKTKVLMFPLKLND